MVIFQGNREAATTVIAVKHLVGRANSTDATFVTVKYSFLLRFVVVERAYLAVIDGKIFVAFDAGIGLRLFRLTS